MLYFLGYDVAEDLEFIDFLFQYEFLDKFGYNIACVIRNAYRQQKTISYTNDYNFDKVQSNNYSNKDKEIVEMMDANRKWDEITNIINNQEDIELLENYIGKCCTINNLVEKKIDNFELVEKLTDNLYYPIYKLLIYYYNQKYSGYRFDDKHTFYMLYIFIKKDKIANVSKNTGLSINTIKNIIEGNDNFNYNNFKKLLNYYQISY